jgi:hypothetical protein
MEVNTKELRKKLSKKGYSEEEVNDIMIRYVKAIYDPRIQEFKGTTTGDKKKLGELAILCDEILREQVPELYT